MIMSRVLPDRDNYQSSIARRWLQPEKIYRLESMIPIWVGCGYKSFCNLK